MKDCVELGNVHPAVEDHMAESDFTPSMTTGSFLDDLQKDTWDTHTNLGQG